MKFKQFFNEVTSNKIQNILSEYKNFLNEKGINLENIKLLGKGDNGEAYLLQSGGILKATFDTNELWLSKHLENKKYNHICEIYKVVNFRYEVPKWDSWKYGNFGVIVQERIYPLNATEAKIFNDAVFEVLHNLPESINYTYPFMELSWGQIEKSNPENKNFQNSILILKNKFNFDKMLQDIKASGIVVDDFHSGNIGKKNNGTYAVFDLGGPNSKVRREF
jgi:hypothetical protein